MNGLDAAGSTALLYRSGSVARRQQPLAKGNHWCGQTIAPSTRLHSAVYCILCCQCIVCRVHGAAPPVFHMNLESCLVPYSSSRTHYKHWRSTGRGILDPFEIGASGGPYMGTRRV